MRLAILDTETTGKDPKTGHLLEVAIGMLDTVTGRLIDAESRLVCVEPIVVGSETNPAVEINGIPDELLGFGWEPGQVAAWLFARAQKADVIVAHNAEFDRAWVPDLKKPWVCSCDDIEWPRPSGSRSLVALALSHGIGVVYAHRALSDVLTLAHLFERAHEMGSDLDAMVRRAMRPKGMFQALVSYDDREAAKNAGFRWEPEAKRWVKRMFLEDVPTLGFKTRELSR